MKIFLAGGLALFLSLVYIPRMRVKYAGSARWRNIPREVPEGSRGGEKRGVQGPSICHGDDASPMSEHDLRKNAGENCGTDSGGEGERKRQSDR